MDIGEKLSLYKIGEEIQFGLFYLDGIGEFLYIKDIPKNEIVYKSITLKRNLDLVKWINFYVKKVRVDINTYLEDYSNVIIKLIEEKDRENKFFLSLTDRYVPKEIIDLSLTKLGIKEILKDPSDSRIWIINFEPYTDSNKHSAVWNYISQSEDVLRTGIERVLTNLSTDNKDFNKDISFQKRLNMIVSLIMNKRNTIIEEEDVKENDEVDVIKLFERNILDKFTDSNILHRLNQTVYALDDEVKKELERAGYNDRFYSFKYNKGNMELIYYRLKELQDSLNSILIYTDKVSRDIIKFTNIDDLFAKILELEVNKGKINNILSDKDKINLKLVLEKLYLNVNIPYDKLETDSNN